MHTPDQGSLTPEKMADPLVQSKKQLASVNYFDECIPPCVTAYFLVFRPRTKMYVTSEPSWKFVQCSCRLAISLAANRGRYEMVYLLFMLSANENKSSFH